MRKMVVLGLTLALVGLPTWAVDASQASWIKALVDATCHEPQGIEELRKRSALASITEVRAVPKGNVSYTFVISSYIYLEGETPSQCWHQYLPEVELRASPRSTWNGKKTFVLHRSSQEVIEGLLSLTPAQRKKLLTSDNRLKTVQPSKDGYLLTFENSGQIGTKPAALRIERKGYFYGPCTGPKIYTGTLSTVD